MLGASLPCRFSLAAALQCVLVALWLHPAAAGWKLLWKDEFKGKALDTRKWQYEIGTGCQYLSDNWPMCGFGNSEVQYYSPNNVAVRKGRLEITARCEADWTLTSGRIHTLGRFSVAPDDNYTTVRVAARVKLPQGAGLWPAFWMLPVPPKATYCIACGDYGKWAASGEIDILESQNDMSMLWSVLQFGGAFPANTLRQALTPADPANASASWAGQWHTFGIEWQKEEIRWFVDGQPVNNTDGTPFVMRSGKGSKDPNLGWFSDAAGAGPESPFDRQFYLVLNLALGGQFTGKSRDEVTATLYGAPKAMEVDWVRVHGWAE